MLRNSISIITGYIIFVATSIAFFKLSGHDPHADSTTFFIILTAIYGGVFSFAAGIVTQLIAKAKNLQVNYLLAFIIVGFALFSFFKSDGNHWTQILAIFIFAPVSMLGGLLYNRRDNK